MRTRSSIRPPFSGGLFFVAFVGEDPFFMAFVDEDPFFVDEDPFFVAFVDWEYRPRGWVRPTREPGELKNSTVIASPL